MKTHVRADVQLRRLDDDTPLTCTSPTQVGSTLQRRARVHTVKREAAMPTFRFSKLKDLVGRPRQLKKECMIVHVRSETS